MKRNVLLLALVGLMPMLAVAQDDMYFYTNGDADKVRSEGVVWERVFLPV